MKTVVSAASNFTSSLTSVGQSTYMGQQQSSTAMYGSSLQQQTGTGTGGGGTGSGSGSGSGSGGRSNQYQYYSSQTQQQPAAASQQHLQQYYTSSQVLPSSMIHDVESVLVL